MQQSQFMDIFGCYWVLWVSMSTLDVTYMITSFLLTTWD